MPTFLRATRKTSGVSSFEVVHEPSHVVTFSGEASPACLFGISGLVPMKGGKFRFPGLNGDDIIAATRIDLRSYALYFSDDQLSRSAYNNIVNAELSGLGVTIQTYEEYKLDPD